MDCASMHNLIRREVRILLFPVRKNHLRTGGTYSIPVNAPEHTT